MTLITVWLISKFGIIFFFLTWTSVHINVSSVLTWLKRLSSSSSSSVSPLYSLWSRMLHFVVSKTKQKEFKPTIHRGVSNTLLKVVQWYKREGLFVNKLFGLTAGFWNPSGATCPIPTRPTVHTACLLQHTGSPMLRHSLMMSGSTEACVCYFCGLWWLVLQSSTRGHWCLSGQWTGWACPSQASRLHLVVLIWIIERFRKPSPGFCDLVHFGSSLFKEFY